MKISRKLGLNLISLSSYYKDEIKMYAQTFRSIHTTKSKTIKF